MKDSLMVAILIFHMTNITLAENSKFYFIGSIPEVMFRDVPVASKVLEAYRKIPVFGFRPLTDEIRKSIEEADKPKKRGTEKGTKVGLSEPVQSAKKSSK